MTQLLFTIFLGALLFTACDEADDIAQPQPASTPTSVPTVTSTASPTQTPIPTPSPKAEDEIASIDPTPTPSQWPPPDATPEPDPTATPSQWPPPDATPDADIETPQAIVDQEQAELPPGATHIGEFRGTDVFHKGRGTALLIRSDSDRYTIRLLDFFVTEGPDLFVYLSPDPEDWTRTALEVSALRGNEGTFDYDVPPGTDMSQYRSVIIWCKSFSVLFAVAPLTEL